jgi:hypothetical protein
VRQAFAETLDLFPGLYSDSVRTHSGRFTNLSADKLRGGFYTPRAVADWLCLWAVRTKTDIILEPSCGIGVFLEATVDRLLALGARPSCVASQISGIEINPAESAAARARLRSRLGHQSQAVIETDDFFSWWTRPGRRSFDVVVGNPHSFAISRSPSLIAPGRCRSCSALGSLQTGLRTFGSHSLLRPPKLSGQEVA